MELNAMPATAFKTVAGIFVHTEKRCRQTACKDLVILNPLNKPVCHLSQRLLHRAWPVAEGFRRGGVAELTV